MQPQPWLTVTLMLGTLLYAVALAAPAATAGQEHVATAGEFNFKGPGTAEFSAQLPDIGVYDVIIELVRPNMVCNLFVVYERSPNWWSHNYMSENDNNVRQFIVRFNGRNVPVPLSAYSDMLQVEKISYEIAGNQLLITIRAYGIVFQLIFNQSGYLISRRAYNDTWPYVPDFEVTEYSIPD